MPRTNKKTPTATSQAPQSDVAASDELLPLDNEEKEFMEQVSKSLQQTTDAFMQKQKQELSALLTNWKTQSLAYLVEERRKMTKRSKKAKKQENAQSPSEQNPTTQTEQQPAKTQQKKNQTKQKEETQQQPEGSASTSSPQGSPSLKRQPAEKKEAAKKSPATPKPAPTAEGESSEATTTAQSKKKEKKEKPKYIHNSASVELRIPATQTNLIQEWSNKVITEDKLFVDPYDPTFGRETDSHVTVCMNLPDEAYTEIEGIANATNPLTLKFTEATVYPGNGFDSIVLPVQPTSELFQLREEVSKHCIRAGAARRPPHCVIAYVKRGTGHKLLKEQPFKLEDSPLCNEIVFVERTGNKRVFQTKK